MGLAYLVFENLAKSFNTAAEAFLQKQQSMGMRRLDYLFIGPSIITFAKTLAPNCEFTNLKHVMGQRQLIGGTN